MSQVVVLAGGLGTRMRPLSDRVPKVLLPVAGRPFLSWLLERLAGCDVSEVLLCVGHLGAQVRAALTREPARRLVVRVSEEPSPRGTAGALRHALPLLAPELVVTYGDSYLPFEYSAPLARLRAEQAALGCMAVWQNRGELEPSNVELSGEWVARYQKPTAGGEDPTLTAIDYGATALRREVIAALPAEQPLDLAEVLGGLAARRTLLALPVQQRFFEVGSPQGLSALEALLSRQVRS